MSTTPYTGKFTPVQQTELIDLLWSHLKRDPDFKDRKRTGWGTKTTTGRLASIESIVYGPGDFQVRMESEEYGEEVFNYDTLEEAKDGMYNLRTSIEKESDGIERHLELVEVIEQESLTPELGDKEED